MLFSSIVMLTESFLRSLCIICYDLRKYDSILSKCNHGKSLLLSLIMAQGGMSTKGQRVSTANEGSLTSEAAFLFASVPRLSFHGNFTQEPHAECLEDTVKHSKRVFLSVLLYHSFCSCMVEKKGNPLSGEHVTLGIPAVHP